MSFKRYSTPTTAADSGAKVLSPTGVNHTGKFYGLMAENATVSTIYVQVFDANTAPSAGAVPLLEVPVLAGSQSTLYLDGVKTLSFTKGLVIAASSTQWQFTSISNAMFLVAWYELLN